jgi:hypothetical protein
MSAVGASSPTVDPTLFQHIPPAVLGVLYQKGVALQPQTGELKIPSATGNPEILYATVELLPSDDRTAAIVRLTFKGIYGVCSREYLCRDQTIEATRFWDGQHAIELDCNLKVYKDTTKLQNHRVKMCMQDILQALEPKNAPAVPPQRCGF